MRSDKTIITKILKITGAGLLIAALLLSASACAGSSSGQDAQHESVPSGDIRPQPNQQNAGIPVSYEDTDEDYSGGVRDYSRALARRTQSFSPEDAVLTAVAKDLPRVEKDYTVMVYMIGSDLESRRGNATKDMEEMEEASLTYDNVNLLLYTGGAKRWVGDVPADRNNVIDMSASGQDRIVAQTESNANMGAAETLTEFVNFCTSNYPAEHFALILWDHGGGSLWGYGADELYSSDSLLLPEMDSAMASTVFAGDRQLDIVGFDACLMATLENMAIWQKYADRMVASEELEPGEGWDYSFLSILERDQSPDAVAGAILDSFSSYYEAAKSDFSNPDITLSCTDLSKIEDVVMAVDALSEQLETVLGKGGFSQLMQQRAQAKSFGLTENALGEVSFYYDLVDLADLADYLSYIMPEEAERLKTSVSGAVIAQTANINAACGISMYYPYRNKGQFSDFEEIYSSVAVSDHYRNFLKGSAEEWLSGRSRSWKLGLPEDTGDEYVLRLDEEQLANISGASYTILSQKSFGGYSPLEDSVSIEPDEDGEIHLPKSLPVICLSSDTQNDSPWPVTGVEADEDRIVFKTLNTALTSDLAHMMLYGDLITELISIVMSLDRESGEVEIKSVISGSSESDFSGKNTIDIDKWEGIYYNYGSYAPSADPDGTIRPFGEWNNLGIAGISSAAVDRGFGFYAVDSGEIPEQLYCQIQLEDTNGEFYATEVFPLAKDDSVSTSVVQTDAGAMEFLVYDDHAELSSYSGTDTDITVPDSVEGKTVTGIGSGVFGKMVLFDSEGTYPIEKIKIPDSVEEIGTDAFYGCRYLEQINMPKNLKTIGASAFFFCESLENVNLPEGLETIAKGAFSYCTGLKGLNIPSTVKYIGESIMMGCRSAQKITASSGLKDYVVADGALYTADGKTLIAWPGAGGDSCTVKAGCERIGAGAFATAELRTVSLPEGLKEIGNYGLYDCENLKIPELPDSIEEIGMFAFDIEDMIYEWADLPSETTEIRIGPNVSHIGECAFDGYINRRFSISEQNRYYAVRDGLLVNKAGDALLAGSFNDRFQFIVPDGVLTFDFIMLRFLGNFNSFGDSTVKHIFIPESVVNMPEDDYAYGVSNIVIHCAEGSEAEKYALKYGFEVSHITKPEYSTAEEKTADGVMTFRIYDDYALLESYAGHDKELTVPETAGGKPVRVIGSGERAIARNSYSIMDGMQYEDSPELEKIIIPEGVEQISKEALSDFKLFSTIELTLPSTLKIIESEGLQIAGSINLPGSLEWIGSRFTNSRIQNGFAITENTKYIDPYAFADCRGISEFTQTGSNDIYSVKDGIVYSADGEELMFYPLEGPESALIPEGVVRIGAHAFDSNTNITEVVFPASLKSIGEQAFYSCAKLADVSFGNVKESIVIGEQAFCNCSSLTEVELNRVEEIGSSAFRYCASLEKVIFDEGLLSVGSSAFEGTAYAVIDLPDSLRKIDSYAFGGYGEDVRPGSSGTIHIGPDVSRIGEGAFTAIGATAFDVDPGNTHFASAGGLLISKGGDRVISCPSGIKGRVDIPDGTVYIDDWAFSFAHDVTEVHIPDSVVAIGTVNFDRVDSGKTDASGNSIREYTVTFYCSEGSFAHEFALERGIPFKLE